MELESLMKFWPLLVSLVVTVVWNVRLESKVLYLEKDHTKELEANSEKEKLLWAKFDKVVDELSAVKIELTKLSTRIEINQQQKT